MNWLRRVLTRLFRGRVAEPEIPPTPEVIREARRTRRDLRELRRLEVIVKRR